jgi:ABC-type polysaccharide/polyol phosphate export permease
VSAHDRQAVFSSVGGEEPSGLLGVVPAAVRELIQRRDLLYMITWRELRIRYKQSVIGILWAVLMPLVIVSAGIVVRFAFSTLSGSPVKLTDLTTVTVKAAPWAFLVAALRFGTNSLVSNTTLVTKIYLPRLIFPISAVASQLIDFLVAAAVILVLLVIAGAGISLQVLWVPLLLLGLVMLAVGLAILLSAASLFFRDVKYIVEVLLTFAIFFTPVFYESSLLGRWAPLLRLNPVAPLLEALSTTVVQHRSPDGPWLAYSFSFASVLLIGSIVAFKKLEPLFAESV